MTAFQKHNQRKIINWLGKKGVIFESCSHSPKALLEYSELNLAL